MIWEDSGLIIDFTMRNMLRLGLHNISLILGAIENVRVENCAAGTDRRIWSNKILKAIFAMSFELLHRPVVMARHYADKIRTEIGIHPWIDPTTKELLISILFGEF